MNSTTHPPCPSSARTMGGSSVSEGRGYSAIDAAVESYVVETSLFAYAFRLEEPSPRLGSTLPRESEILRFELKPTHPPCQTNTPSQSEFSEDMGRVEHQRGEGLQRDQCCSRILCCGNFFVRLRVQVGRTLSSPRLDSPRESEILRFELEPTHPSCQTNTPSQSEFSEDEGRVER